MGFRSMMAATNSYRPIPDYTVFVAIQFRVHRMCWPCFFLMILILQNFNLCKFFTVMNLITKFLFVL